MVRAPGQWTNIGPLHYVQSRPEGEDIYRIKSRNFSGVMICRHATPARGA